MSTLQSKHIPLPCQMLIAGWYRSLSNNDNSEMIVLITTNYLFAIWACETNRYHDRIQCIDDKVVKVIGLKLKCNVVMTNYELKSLSHPNKTVAVSFIWQKFTKQGSEVQLGFTSSPKTININQYLGLRDNSLISAGIPFSSFVLGQHLLHKGIHYCIKTKDRAKYFKIGDIFTLEYVNKTETLTFKCNGTIYYILKKEVTQVYRQIIPCIVVSHPGVEVKFHSIVVNK